jgi:hypothetical protein
MRDKLRQIVGRRHAAAHHPPAACSPACGSRHGILCAQGMELHVVHAGKAVRAGIPPAVVRACIDSVSEGEEHGSFRLRLTCCATGHSPKSRPRPRSRRPRSRRRKLRRRLSWRRPLLWPRCQMPLRSRLLLLAVRAPTPRTQLPTRPCALTLFAQVPSLHEGAAAHAHAPLRKHPTGGCKAHRAMLHRLPFRPPTPSGGRRARSSRPRSCTCQRAP